MDSATRCPLALALWRMASSSSASSRGSSGKDGLMALLRPGAKQTVVSATAALSCGSATDTAAAVASLSAAKQKQLWETLQQIVEPIVLDDGFAESNESYSAVAAGEEDGDAETKSATTFERSLALLKACAVAAHSWATEPSHHLPATFMPLAETLQGALFMLKGPAGEDARGAIIKLCCGLWEQKRKGAAAVTTLTLPVLLLLANMPGATETDIKRCVSMRDALSLVDLDDESAADIKEVLAQCFLNPVFLRSREGRKLLEFVLVELTAPMVRDAYAAIVNQLPYCHASELTAYGSLFLRAWTAAAEVPGADATAGLGALSAADGAAAEAASPRQLIEEVVIQDLMIRAVSAARSEALSAVRRALAPIMAAKKVPQVDAMVARLYGPILWRSLEAGSPAVRGNAVALLVDAFPVVDPTAPKQQSDAAMQRNFTALYLLLSDPVPAVRVAAAQGCCRVLSSFWELVPAATTKRILARVAGECARDSASTAVRAAAVDGLAFLLGQVLAHPVLASLLPVLGPLLHDRSERVRAAFLGLLLRVQSLRSVRLFDIAPVDDLMARLVLDAGSSKAHPLLIQLLLPSLLPSDASASELLSRVVKGLRAHPTAARAFYASAHLAASPAARTRLALVLHKTLVKGVAAAATAAATATAPKRGGIDSRNTRLMADVAGALRAVWAGLDADVLRPGEPDAAAGQAAGEGADSHRALRRKLLDTVTQDSLLGLLRGICGDMPAVSGAPTDAASAAAAALLGIAATLGPEAGAAIAASWAWPLLSSSVPGSRAHAAAVDALCGFGLALDLVRACIAAISTTTSSPSPATSAAGSAAAGVHALSAGAALAAIERVLAANPSDARAVLLSDSACTAALQQALQAGVAPITAALALASAEAEADGDGDGDGATSSHASRAGLELAVRCAHLLARVSSHAGMAAAGSPSLPFAAPKALLWLAEWTSATALPAMASLCVPASQVADAVAPVSASLASRAASDAAAAVVAVVADAVAMGSAGDAALQLLRAMANASTAAAVAALPPPSALLYSGTGASAASAPAAGRRRGGRKRPASLDDDHSPSPPSPGAEAGPSPSPWAPSYAPALHGGNPLLSHSLRLAARFVALAAAGSSPAGAPSELASAQTAAAAALCLLAAASEPRCLAPTAASAEPEAAAAVKAACQRESRGARAVWAGCVRRLVAACGGDVASATATIVASALPEAVRAMGSGAEVVGEALAAAAGSPGDGVGGAASLGAVSGVDELGFGLREALKPLAVDDSARLRLAEAAAATLLPLLEVLAETPRAGAVTAPATTTAADAAKAEIAAARTASKLAYARDSALPWLATLSAMAADMGPEAKAALLAGLRAVPAAAAASSSAGGAPRQPLGELLQAASVSVKGPFAAVADQLGLQANPIQE